MLKIIVGITITAITTFIGKKLSDKFVYRDKFFAALISFNNRLISNLSYKKEELPVFIKNDFGFDDFNSTVSSLNFGLSDLGLSFPDYLKKDDVKISRDYFIAIGKQSNFAETKYLRSMDRVFSEIKEKTAIQAEKSKSLGIKLGFSLGVIVFIIIL